MGENPEKTLDFFGRSYVNILDGPHLAACMARAMIRIIRGFFQYKNLLLDK